MRARRGVTSMASSYVILALAIALEVAADVILEYTKGFTAVGPSLLTLVLFVSSLVLFSRVLLSINLSVAYATWSAAGTTAMRCTPWPAPPSGRTIRASRSAPSGVSAPWR